MISVRFERSREDGSIRFFELKDHAGFDKYGRDIVCAAASALSINTINSLKAFTKDRFDCDASSGLLWVRFAGVPSPEASLLMESLVLGLSSIEESYGSKHLHLTFDD